MILMDELEAKITQHIPKRLKGRRSASVAIVLHENHTTNDVEMLFIRRALNPRDRWSGHIAFPGGHVEKNETPIQAACREAHEEIGLDLSNARYIGQLDDRFATRRGLVVSACVFILETKPASFKLQASEVSDAFWVSFPFLASSPRRFLQYSTVNYSRYIQRSLFLQKLLGFIGLLAVPFPCLHLPHSSIDPLVSQREAHQYVLWGISYSMCLDLFHLQDLNHPVKSAIPSYFQIFLPAIASGVVLLGCIVWVVS